MRYARNIIWLMFVIVLFGTAAVGCSGAKASPEVPEYTEAEEIVVDEKDHAEEIINTVEEVVVTEPEVTTSPASISLDFSEVQAFVPETEEEIGAYHESIDKVLIYDMETVKAIYDDVSLADIRQHLEAYTYNMTPGEIGIISDPESPFVLCNKLNKLPDGYVPSNLVEPQVPFSFAGDDMKRYMRKDAAEALEILFEDAKESGVDMVAVSGYRSYDRQDAIYTYNVETRGVEETDKVSSRPGHSEHQTGLAMDVSSESIGYALEPEFDETDEGKWLVEHAHEYGFIIRYEKNRENITGYTYEPWHIRYIGIEIASFLYEHDLTLEILYATYLEEE